MKAIFNKQQILGIALKVREYERLYVTTDGQMFLSEKACEDAVRTKNQIIAEPADYVGYIIITKDMVSNDKLREYGAKVATFCDLFKEAKLPRQKKVAAPETRKPETPKADDPKVVSDLEEALGLSKSAEPKPATEPKPAEQK